jgi:hypothetical protein
MSVQPQISYNKSDTTSATNTTTSYSDEDVVLDPTFPSRHPNIVKSLYGRTEVGVTVGTSASPQPTNNRTVLFEDAEGLPGVLNYIWNALGGSGLNEVFQSFVGTDSGFQYHFYFDDKTTPAFSVDAFELFTFMGGARAFETPRVGVSKIEGNDVIDYDGFGAYRYFFAPYRYYCRVEVENANPNNYGIWAQVGGFRLKDEYSGSKKTWTMVINAADAVAQYDLIDAGIPSLAFFKQFNVPVVAPVKGQIESVSARFRIVSGAVAAQEGDIALFSRADNPLPDVRSTGMEDWSNSAFGTARYESSDYFAPSVSFDTPGATHTHNFVDPVTGDAIASSTPSAASGAHTHTVLIRGVTYTTDSVSSGGSGTTSHIHTILTGIPAAKPTAWPAGSHNGFGGVMHYRFLQNDPFFFEDGFKARWHVGQFGQPGNETATVDVRLCASAWADGWRSQNTNIMPSPGSAALESRRIYDLDFANKSLATLPSFFGGTWVDFGAVGGTITFTNDGMKIEPSPTYASDTKGIAVPMPTTAPTTVHPTGSDIDSCLLYTATGKIDARLLGSGAPLALMNFGVSCRGAVAPLDGTGGNGVVFGLPPSSPGGPTEYQGFVEHRYRNTPIQNVLIGKNLDMDSADITLAVLVDRRRDYSITDVFYYYYSLPGENTWIPLGWSDSQIAFAAAPNQRHITISSFSAVSIWSNFSVYKLPRVRGL